MDIESTFLLDTVTVIDSSNWSDEDYANKIKSLSKKRKEEELYLVTSLPIQATIETFPEGQVLTITIDNINDTSGEEVESFLKGLGSLRDYYPDLTVKIVDNTEQLSASGLPEDTVVKIKTGT